MGAKFTDEALVARAGVACTHAHEHELSDERFIDTNTKTIEIYPAIRAMRYTHCNERE